MNLHRRSQALDRRTRSTSLRRRLSAALRLAPLLIACSALALPASAADPKSGIAGVVNVNTASVEELQLLPGVGESRAEAIIDRREAQGGFQSVDDLEQVKGVGSKLLEKMRPYLTLTGKTTARRL